MPMYKILKTRPNATQWHTNLIANAKVMHMDTYLFQTEDDDFVFVMGLREGGRKLIARSASMVIISSGSIFPVDMDLAPNQDRWMPRCINDRYFSAAARAPIKRALEYAHWRHIYRYCVKLRGQHAQTSILLHYIRQPDIDPTQGYHNYWLESGYAHPLEGLL